ncbi:phosphoadenosine phosphosulfate reductase [Siphonobacter sp. BAB-5405]|uniref:phosphoadenosine phosphosulfate reductase family protein n=1 Tax=Siphonobacter sp. BAB-5405 TaxID=1864825 RepID=UPI000C8080A2|nr:phosphoadenosine phosphosulfate reductase family protein [Siphonobacter sp. BAB-5405]PMD95683.1 phosphoadenosine phosphosulfate reductase [Siphonobacter sp. BAB-5405]
MKVRHVLGISGGKDSAALAIYMKDHYPHLDIEYYTCDTGKELDETYQLIKNLEVYLGKSITRIQAAQSSNEVPFDHFLEMYGGYLPSSSSRWCTKKLKLEPFEKFVGNDLVISYVGIRGDEDREGYISKKTTIQSIFPFRKNIWSEDVINKLLGNVDSDIIMSLYKQLEKNERSQRFQEILSQQISFGYTQNQKLNQLLDCDTLKFNQLVFSFLKTTDYPIAKIDDFPLIENDDVLVRDDIFNILENSGVGIPEYYKKIPFNINGKESHYSRSRSGCFFCFYQQKIEWVWLYEQHPDLYLQAMEYEKDGYAWNQEETLADLIKPERIKRIKEEYIKRTSRKAQKSNSPFLVDILSDAESEGCASCFI